MELEGDYQNYCSRAFEGNPVSCAIASAVLDVIEKEKLIQHAQYIGQLLVEGARKLALKYQVKIFVDC